MVRVPRNVLSLFVDSSSDSDSEEEMESSKEEKKSEEASQDKVTLTDEPSKEITADCLESNNGDSSRTDKRKSGDTATVNPTLKKWKVTMCNLGRFWEDTPTSNCYLTLGPAIVKLLFQQKSLEFVCDISRLSAISDRFAVWDDHIYHLTHFSDKPVDHVYCYNASGPRPRWWGALAVDLDFSPSLDSYLVVISDELYIFNLTEKSRLGRLHQGWNYNCRNRKYHALPPMAEELGNYTVSSHFVFQDKLFLCFESLTGELPNKISSYDWGKKLWQDEPGVAKQLEVLGIFSSWKMVLEDTLVAYNPFGRTIEAFNLGKNDPIGPVGGLDFGHEHRDHYYNLEQLFIIKSADIGRELFLIWQVDIENFHICKVRLDLKKSLNGSTNEVYGKVIEECEVVSVDNQISGIAAPAWS